MLRKAKLGGRFKMKKQAMFGVLLALALTVANAASKEWPRLLGNDENHPECKTALKLAQLAYKSTAFNLWEPQTLPEDLDDTLVLGPQGVDLSGGDALDVNLGVFTKIPLPYYGPRSIYWQTQTDQANRLVVEEIPFGWRGDAYAVQSIPTEMSPAEYFSDAVRHENDGLTMLIDNAWRAPLIFQGKNSTHLWLIYVGEPYFFSPGWVIYLPIAGRMQKACEVQFRPRVKHAASLLPRSIQRLATLLDRSIGSGENEGTLQPTARIRINVQQAWSNAALRPWAMSTPYNSRKEVEAGLSIWAEHGKMYQVAYAQIQAQYRIAEGELRSYYNRQLNMSKIASQIAAKNVLDIAYRAHYVFPKKR